MLNDIFIMRTRQLFVYNMHKISVPRLLRSHCTKSMYRSANTIRKEFLDYFTKELQHDIIHSSPVSLLNDHSTAFVNAGMNQVCSFVYIIPSRLY